MASTIHIGTDPKRRISAEFYEMPGLRLTLTQASRLFGLEVGECISLLNGLVDEGFLVRSVEGLYGRATAGRLSPRAFWT
jgi:hypothetical protein